MQIKYRPDIDGLRALSVFGIIFYHLKISLFNFNLISGGFLGVDIFFVISGYLITSLILKEYITLGNFSFKNFYIRRVRRILPAYLFIVSIVSLFSYFILLPLSLKDFGQSLFSSIFFVSNIFFWIKGQKYGDDSELLRPLLHTWSLSVEEQFYILLPIFLIFALKFFRNYLLIILLLTTFLSIIFVQFTNILDYKLKFSLLNFEIPFFNKFNFYFLTSRLFELTIGSIIAYLNIYKKNLFYLNYNNFKYLSYFGLLLILCSFTFLDLSKNNFPSLITLIPILGVSLIIFFSKEENFIYKILSNKILVFFGLISYSLYLWHYPIFAFFRYLEIFENYIFVKIFSVLLTILLSILTYFFIEKPFRNKKIVSFKFLFFYISILVFTLLTFSLYILNTNGIKQRFSNIVYERLGKDLTEDKLSKGFKKNLLIIGDSHAKSLEYNLNKQLINLKYNLIRMETDLYLDDFNKIDRKTNKIDNKYQTQINEINKIISNQKNLIVVWHQRWTYKLEETVYGDDLELNHNNKDSSLIPYYFMPINSKSLIISDRIERVSEAIKKQINKISDYGHSIILVYPVPEMKFHVPRKMKQQNIFNFIFKKKNYSPILSISYDDYKKRNKKIFNVLDSLTNKNVYRVYPEKSFCNTKIPNKCIGNDNNYLFYYDNHHLSIEGSKIVVDDIINKIKDIENN